MAQFQRFGEISKVEEQDDGTIKVFGVASTGTKDSAGETVTAAAMKAALPDYERFPALREMHGLSAAGRTVDAVVDDDGITRVEAHVVDPVAILKVKTGVYQGFSIGGKVLARDPADRTIITKLKLNEISLVDRPCNPEATIDLWKADTNEESPMTVATAPWAPSNKDVKERAEAMAKAAGKPDRRNDYVAKAREALIAENAELEAELAKATEVVEPDGGTQVVEPVAEIVDDTNKVDAVEAVVEPVDMVAALEASIAKATAAVETPAEPVIKAHVTPGLDDMAKALNVIAAGESADPLSKGLYTVGWLARILSDLSSLQQSSAWEEENEGDMKSVVPAALAQQVNALGITLISMAQEEVAELIAALPTDAVLISPNPVSDDMAYAEKIVDLVKADTDLMEKVGKRNSKADAAKLQAMHDATVTLGAACATTEKTDHTEDLAKAATETARLNEVLGKATTAIDDLVKVNADLQKRLEAVENMAAPPKAVVTPAGLTVISKTADVDPSSDNSADTLNKADVAAMIASLTPEELGNIQVRMALKTPMRLGARA